MIFINLLKETSIKTEQNDNNPVLKDESFDLSKKRKEISLEINKTNKKSKNEENEKIEIY